MPRREKTKPSNQKFKTRFEQEALTWLSFEAHKKAILILRSLWGIPAQGFPLNDSGGLKEWINIQSRDKYKKVRSVMRVIPYIQANPKTFLEKIESALEDNEYPDTLYLFDNEKRFKALIREKPFPGIVHYIIWNKILIPETNELQLNVDKDGFPILRMGPNTTVQDVVEIFDLIDGLLQKRMARYKKGKSRYKRNFVRDAKIYQVLTKQIANYKVSYDAVDMLEGNMSDKKKLAHIRQIKRRYKKLENSN